MSNLKIARIEAYIQSNFSGLVDVSDVKESEQKITLLTRSIAAMAIISSTGSSIEDASESIVDGPHDGGIDSIFYHGHLNTVFFVQSKWSTTATKTIDVGTAHKLVAGVQKLLENDFSTFNEKVKRKTDIINRVIQDASTKIVLCATYNSNNSIDPEVMDVFNKYINDINDASDIMRFQSINLHDLYDVAAKKRGPVNEDVMIRNFSKISSPKPVYYGQVCATELALWYEKSQELLFSQNIRSFIGDTEINNSLVDSLTTNPEIFFYCNNGITVLASTIAKKPIGGDSRDSGVFECTGMAVINGAQTVGACYKAKMLGVDRLGDAFVFAKFIEVGTDDPQETTNFSNHVTRTANTQNKVERRDFVSLDPYQKELQEGLDILGVKYVYKNGEKINDGEKGFDLNLATLALVSDYGDINLAAMAKREIGKIWDKIKEPPYTLLFNRSKGAYYIKNIANIFISIQSISQEYAKNTHINRKEQYAIHGNVLLALICMKDLAKDNIHDENYDLKKAFEHCKTIIPVIFEKVYSVSESKYPGAYLAYLFRNTGKIKEIATGIIPIA